MAQITTLLGETLIIKTLVISYIYTTFAMWARPYGWVYWAILTCVGAAFASEWRIQRRERFRLTSRS